MPRTVEWFFLSGFPTNILCEPFLYVIKATCPVYLILFDVINLIIFGVQ